MIDRYSTKDMRRIWTEHAAYGYWNRVEQAVLAERGLTDDLPQVFAADVARHELRTRHDVAAYLAALREQLPPGSDAYRLLHHGMTSSDLVDTATGLRLHDSNHLIGVATRRLLDSVAQLMVRAGDLAGMGRTHGRHAEPMPLVHQFRGWQVLAMRISRLGWQSEFYGKLSGATGQHLTLAPDLEQQVLRRLGLKRAPHTSQIVPRWVYADWYYHLAELAGLCCQIATWVRLSSIEGLDEAHEGQFPDQVGSTAMPHKTRNPVNAERIVGLSKHARRLAYELASLGDELWWQRDLTHSSVERIDLPNLCCLAEWLPLQTSELLDNLVLDPQRIASTIHQPSSAVMLTALVDQGNDPDYARAVVARHYHDQEDDRVAQSRDRGVDQAQSGDGQSGEERTPEPGLADDAGLRVRSGVADQ